MEHLHISTLYAQNNRVNSQPHPDLIGYQNPFLVHMNKNSMTEKNSREIGVIIYFQSISTLRVDGLSTGGGAYAWKKLKTPKETID